jgi:hypothetical protein
LLLHPTGFPSSISPDSTRELHKRRDKNRQEEDNQRLFPLRPPSLPLPFPSILPALPRSATPSLSLSLSIPSPFYHIIQPRQRRPPFGFWRLNPQLLPVAGLSSAHDATAMAMANTPDRPSPYQEAEGKPQKHCSAATKNSFPPGELLPRAWAWACAGQVTSRGRAE